MNALLIAGVIGLVLWWQHGRRRAVRRSHRPSDYTLSHALRSRERWD